MVRESLSFLTTCFWLCDGRSTRRMNVCILAVIGKLLVDSLMGIFSPGTRDFIILLPNYTYVCVIFFGNVIFEELHNSSSTLTMILKPTVKRLVFTSNVITICTTITRVFWSISWYISLRFALVIHSIVTRLLRTSERASNPGLSARPTGVAGLEDTQTGTKKSRCSWCLCGMWMLICDYRVDIMFWSSD